ncbi:MAG: SAM-dependent DNA methyltransferase, partial [Lewinella sp.]|nr:SAM-dependent DNA methyltransferase [Lewinella sp.]
RRVSMEEIEKNGYNLNISRYVSTAEDEIEIDLAKVNERLTSIDVRIQKKTEEHNQYLKELKLKTI